MKPMVEERKTKRILAGLIGSGIGSSLSPMIHEQEARELGIDCFYQLINLDTFQESPAELLPRILNAAELLGFSGFNITHPCKQMILPLLSKLSVEAEAIGAVNTVLFTKEGRIGHNTDAPGFAENFRRTLLDAPLAHVVLLGAGGAGAAVAYAALTLGVGRLSIFDLDRDRAVALAQRLAGSFGPGRAFPTEDLSRAMADADGLIQATPIGMDSHPGMPVDAELLRSSLWVAEVIYFPLETELLKCARAKGARTMDGGGMVVFQAAEAFRLFSGVTPDPERMVRHFSRMTVGV